MAISKLKFIQDKKTALTKQQRRLLADLLNQGKESSAKIRVENIIRDDIYIELLEYLELYCELLLARLALLLDTTRTTVDNSLKEAVLSLIFASPHSELKEINSIRDILWFKYGNDFGKQVLENVDHEYVPEKITKRCLADPPSETLVDLYLCEIARTYSAPYSGLKAYLEANAEAEAKDGDDDDEPSGGIGEKNLEEPIAEPIAEPSGGVSAPAKPKSSVQKESDEFDSLKARFAALKGNK